jgi:hypothetical protein
VNPARRIISPREREYDLVLDVVRTLDFNVVPSGFPFSQSLYALRNGMTGEERVIET